MQVFFAILIALGLLTSDSGISSQQEQELIDQYGHYHLPIADDSDGD